MVKSKVHAREYIDGFGSLSDYSVLCKIYIQNLNLTLRSRAKLFCRSVFSFFFWERGDLYTYARGYVDDH